MNLEEFVARFAEEFDETPAEQFKAEFGISPTQWREQADNKQ